MLGGGRIGVGLFRCGSSGVVWRMCCGIYGFESLGTLDGQEISSTSGTYRFWLGCCLLRRLTLQETLQFARGKIPVKRTESLGKGTFVREFSRDGNTGKTPRHKHFVRGYTPGKKTRG